MYPAAQLAHSPAPAADLSVRPEGEPKGLEGRSGKVDVRLRDPLEALATIEPEWVELAAEASESNSYAEAWFVRASLDAFEATIPIRLLEVRRGGCLVGLLPISTETGYGRSPVRFAANWLHANMFLGTPLVRRGEERPFWEAVIDTLDEAGWAPNFLHLRGLVDQGPVHLGLVAAAAARGRGCATVHREARALLASELDARSYYERQIRPKKRKELRRLRHRLEEEGEVRIRTFAAGDDLGAWCDAFLALEKAGWKGEAGSALACAPETEAFFRRALEGARARGRLHFLRLDLDERPIAMLVNFLAPPGSFSFKTAFDEAYARYSPGVLIQLENLAMLDRPDIGWMDSCAVENHPMIDSLWSGRRRIVRVTLRLLGFRRLCVFTACRSLEIVSGALRNFAGRGLA